MPRKEAMTTRMRSIFDRAPVGIAYTSATGAVLEVNQKLCAMLGYTAEELRGTTTLALAHPDDRARHERLTQDLLAGKLSLIDEEQRYLRKSGEPLWVRRKVTLAEEAVDGASCLIEMVEAVGERSEFAQRFRETFDHASVGIMHSSLDRRVLMINRKFCEMVGYSATELQEGSVRRIHHPEDSDADQHLETRLVAGEIDSFSFEKRYVRKDGSIFWAHRTVSLARDEAGRPKYFIRVIEDISARKQAEEELLHLAHYDTLTNLPNRALFRDRLAQTLAQARRSYGILAIMFLDLDRFKTVNDSLGHAMGDLLLKQVAHRLTACVRASDTVGRLAGDEFGIILGGLHGTTDALQVAQKIVQIFTAPFRLDHHERFVTTSIGISIYPTDGRDEDMLIKAADSAMYRVKQSGRNNFNFYAGDISAQAPN
jgi:diguanylate cyclase (GGDEF)-like protein/PAS domain S-box-containing protein